MTLPENFRKQSQVNVNYDFVDILNKSGNVLMYGIRNVASVYSLSRLPLASSETNHETRYTVSVSGLQGEVDFDYSFVYPQMVEGKMQVNVTYFCRAVATQDVNASIKCRIYHYDGVTETEIGAQQTSSTLSETASSYSKYGRALFTFDVSKNFAVGDILRVNVETYSTSTTNCEAGILHDGANRDFRGTVSGSYDTTRPYDSTLQVEIPFSLGGVI